MEAVMILPIAEWQSFLRKQQEQERRLNILEQGLSTWIRGADAASLGFSRTTLYEMRADMRLKIGVDYKYEGRAVYYNRTSLAAINEAQRPRQTGNYITL